MESKGGGSMAAMATQAQRRAQGTGAILEAAQRLFAARGFEATTIDDIAASAGVTKGAVYHYFDSKELVFREVFERAQLDLVEVVSAAVLTAQDPIQALQLGSRAFLEQCLEPAVRQVILIDGPRVLGWVTWREIDDANFMPLVNAGIGAAVPADRPVALLGRLLVGALDEAALILAHAEDPERALAEITTEIDRIIDALLR
jgi:AcrR family transcriptional regulator